MSGLAMRGEHLAIAHDIPGRLRVRLPDEARTDGLADTIAAIDGVTTCDWTPRTRSLLVRYRADAVTPAALLEALVAHAGIELPEPAHSGAGAASGDGHAQPPIAATVTAGVAALNQRIGHATGGRLDLALLVPLALTAWALFDLTRGPIRPLAWSSALWYAHGLFRDHALPGSDD